MPALRRLTVLVVILAAPMLSAAGARAASGTAVIADCYAHSGLTRHYPIAQLESALRTMPADIREYSSCQDVIQRQLLAQEGKLHGSGGSVSGSSGGSSFPVAVVVVIAVLLVSAAGLGALAVRRRR